MSNRNLKFVSALSLAMMAFGCTSNSAKRHYVLAEKLWQESNYSASVAEFDRVTQKDPKGKLGMQALYRSASTDLLFLSRYSEAIRKFSIFSESPAADPKLAWEARKQVGEIYFQKLEQYDQSVLYYQKLIGDFPEAAEVPEFLFRVGRSFFFLQKFTQALEAYDSILTRHTVSEWTERAAFEVGVVFYTRGGDRAKGMGRTKWVDGATDKSYREAITAFQSFQAKFPNSKKTAEAKFFVAAAQEELGLWTEALAGFEALLEIHPSPKTVRIRIHRIQERMAQRKRVEP